MTNSGNGLKVFQILAGPGAGWGGGVVVVEAITRGLVEQGYSVSALCLSDIAGERLREAGPASSRRRSGGAPSTLSTTWPLCGKSTGCAVKRNLTSSTPIPQREG
jgi:hypothetical protein